jgi:hypothetical protein
MNRRSTHAALLWLLTIAFAVRVFGQAVQRWAPQPFLPPFAAFQGSSLPYGVLLTAQLLILIVMAVVARRIQMGALIPNAHTGKLLTWVGGIYMAGSIVRIAIGLIVATAPAWFSTWIPAAFHLVLAAYLLALASYHRR